MEIVSDSVRRARPLLGTFVEITTLSATQPAAVAAIEHAFDAIGRVHHLMSFHDPESDVSRLNFDAASQDVVVDPWTFEVLEASIDLHRRSAGAFDISVAPILQDIGFLPRHGRMLPALAANRSTMEAIELLPGNTVRFRHPSTRIDLGGIAKGYAVDRAVETLKMYGAQSGVVNAGGDLAAFGHEPHAIDIRDPDRPGRILSSIAIRDSALASTGRNFDPSRSIALTGLAVIDPATQTVVHGISGATVCSESCMIADAMTKIVVIAGEQASAVLEHYQSSAMLISADGMIKVSGNWKDSVGDAD